jgi:hypothetical protein
MVAGELVGLQKQEDAVAALLPDSAALPSSLSSG